MIKGYYINLESSQERKAALIENLKSLGIENIYKRFNAIKGDPSDAKKIEPQSRRTWTLEFMDEFTEARNTKHREQLSVSSHHGGRRNPKRNNNESINSIA